MARKFIGQLHIRLSSEAHEELSLESFETNRSKSKKCSIVTRIRYHLLADSTLKRLLAKPEVKSRKEQVLKTHISKAMRFVRFEKAEV